MQREPPGAYGFPIGGVFRAALDAVIVMSADGLVVDWNPAAETMFGYARTEAIGTELADMVIPQRLRERHRSALARYVTTGQATILDRRMEVAGLDAGGREFPVELTITRVPDVDPPLFAGFLRDLSAAKQAEADRIRLETRLAFLAEASAVLDRSLELDETLERLAGLTVPILADLCVIDVVERGSIDAVAAAARSPESARALREVRHRFPLHPAGPHPVAEVLRTGQTVLLPAMTSAYLDDIARGPEHRRLMERLRYRSAIVTPLVSRGRKLGALSVLRMEGSATYGPEDEMLAVELARRAGVAVDNARLYEETRHVAATLQESLLPRSLPQPFGSRVVARYRPAVAAHQIGGDFYDAFEIDEATYGIVIGDVCGKGAEAAALTALARYAIRGAASRDPDPGSVLSAVNETVHRDQGPDGRFLTAIYATASPADGALRLEVAAAGHPRPIVLRADGTAVPMSVGGTALGILRVVHFEVVPVVLKRGEMLVLYTDGVTDAGAPERLLTERDVASVVAASAIRDPDAVAGLLESTALSSGVQRDDLAVLAIAYNGTAPEAGSTTEANAAGAYG